MYKKLDRNILIIDDEPKIRDILKDILEHEGYNVIAVKDGEEGLRVIGTESIDLVLLDLVIPGIDGMEILKHILRRDSFMPVLIISAYGNIPIAVEAIQLGATDFVEKPINMKDLLSRVDKNFKTASQSRDRLNHIKEVYNSYGMIGISPVMQEVYHMIDQIASTNVRVLITGETGTGKEMVARAIHGLSSRANKPFVKINCSAIPSELIESELFGHTKGAFTGAHRDKQGKFRSADGGTLFLDEIGDMSSMTQSKVLRAIEEGEIQPVGLTDMMHIDVRILAATNTNMEEEVAAGRFREDLYYRLNVVVIHLPPLEDRKEDIPDLARYFIGHFCDEHNRQQKNITKRAMEILVKNHWSGNIRELKNFFEKLVIFVNEDLIDLYHVRKLLDLQSVERNLEMDLPLREAREHFERDYITAKLIANEWNIPQTAESLGLARTALYRKMNQLGINHHSNC